MAKLTADAQTTSRQDGLPTIRACLFDMDGLLIDSEDLYTICTNTVLREYGRPDLPWNIKAQLQGRPGPTAGKILHDWAQLPLTPEEYRQKVQACQMKLFPTAKALPGVRQLLQTLSSLINPPVYLALATSSHSGNFKLKTDHIADLFTCFAEENRVLGDDPRIGVGRGKPAPDIYLLALETINEGIRRQGEKEVLPAECLVFEDSVPGVESGRRAGMQVVWCPHPGLLNEYKGREELVLAGLTGEYKGEDAGINGDALGVVSPDGRTIKTGPPGEVNDGWARLLFSLEDFPYEDYGLNA